MAAPDYDPAFLQAVAQVLANEGGYSERECDRGGETRFGISRREYPTLDIEHLTREQAIEIYWRDWWQRFGYGALPRPLSAKVLDLAVNVGPIQATICLQRALRACGVELEEDGILGRATIGLASRVDQAAVLAALRSEAAGHYRLIAASGGGRYFLRGWLNRAYQ